MLRPFFPELVMSTDLLSFEHPSVLQFCFTLLFMTNVTISISTSQIFRSWVAIFQHRPPLESLFHSWYGMPGLAPRMDVLSWGRRDFQIGFSNRDTSRNAWNRHWGNFVVDTGILSNNMNFHLTYLKWHSVTWPYTMTTPYWSDFVPNSTEFWVVSIEHLRRVWHADRGHLIPSLWDLHMFYLLRPILFRTCRYFSGLWSSNIPRYFLDFALYHKINIIMSWILCLFKRNVVRRNTCWTSSDAFFLRTYDFKIHQNL